MKVLWLTDLHLDWVNITSRRQFYARLTNTASDTVVITGDIATAACLSSELLDLGRACAPRPVYFVLGNHDFYGSTLAEVDRTVAEVCVQQPNLVHLGQGEVIPLSATAALIGHRGWADGLAGRGDRTDVKCKDIRHIADLKLDSTKEVFAKLAALGKESATYFQGVLPEALKGFDRIWVATHVPPFEGVAGPTISMMRTMSRSLVGRNSVPCWENHSWQAAPPMRTKEPLNSLKRSRNRSSPFTIGPPQRVVRAAVARVRLLWIAC